MQGPLANRAFSWICLLAFPSVAFGQASTAPDEYTVSLPPSGPSYTVNRIVAGDFNGTSLVDVAVLRNDRVSLAFDPSMGEASTLIPGVFSDLAAVGDVTDPSRRRMIVVGESVSLSELVWKEDDLQFRAESVFDPAGQSMEAERWSRLSQLYTGQVDSSFGEDIIGVASDGVTLQVALANGNGSFDDVDQALFSPQAPGLISDVCVVRSQQSFAARICVATGHQFVAFNLDGTVGDLSMFGTSIMDIESIGETNAPDSAVAILARELDGSFMLFVWDGTSTSTVQSLDLSSLKPNGITSADYDGDGATDIMVRMGPRNDLVCLIRSNGVYSLSPEHVVPIESHVTSGASFGASVVVDDVDNDGDVDVAFPVGSTDQLFVARSSRFDHRDQAPNVLSSSVNGPPHIWMPDPHSIGVRFVRSGLAAAEPVQATHLQLMLWSADLGPTGQYVTARQPDVNIAYVLSDTTLVQQDPYTSTEYVEFEFPAFETIALSTGIHYLTARYVTLDENLELVSSWPHASRYVVRQNNPSAEPYLGGLSFVTIGGGIGADPPDSGGISVSGGTQVGGTGVVGCIPDYPPGTPSEIGQAVEVP